VLAYLGTRLDWLVRVRDGGLGRAGPPPPPPPLVARCPAAGRTAGT
jgi:hypothetical protein